MSEKTIKDRIINLLLSLYLIDRVNEIGKLEDNLKLQKLIFLSQKLLNQRHKLGFRYFFLRWDKGPFSKDVNNDLLLLKNNNFVKWENNQITLTVEGKNLLEMSKEIFDSNKTFIKVIDDTVSEYSHLSPEEIKKEVYNMQMFIPKLRKVMRIEEVPPKQLLMYGLSERKAKYSFEVGEEWVDTLEVIFDSEAIDLLQKAKRDLKMGKYQVLNAL